MLNTISPPGKHPVPVVGRPVKRPVLNLSKMKVHEIRRLQSI